jgi:hypothetical protein
VKAIDWFWRTVAVVAVLAAVRGGFRSGKVYENPDRYNLSLQGGSENSADVS